MDLMPPDSGDGVPPLLTPRLRLRGLAAEDAPAIFRIFSDPEVTRYWSTPALSDEDAARRMIPARSTDIESAPLIKWGVIRLSDEALIGTTTLLDILREHRRATVGYALGRAAWGHGFALEAVRAVVEFAFGALGLFRVDADVDPRNASSIRLLERLGFQREGLLRARYHLNGEVQDSVIYGLLATEMETGSWRSGALPSS